MGIKTKKYTIMAILWAFIVFLITFAPGAKPPTGPVVLFDKLVHFGMFFTLGLLLLKMKRERELEMKKLVYFFLVYALITEVNQIWVPNRSFSLFDLLANLLGVSSFFIRF